MAGIERLARQLNRLEAKVEGLSAGPELAYSSIEDGAIDEYDALGALVGSFGLQFDGSHTAVSFSGPTPPDPVAPTCDTQPGVVTVRWNGKFAGDEVSPLDFKHVAVHVSPFAGFTPDHTTQKATIRGELGDVATLALTPGTYFVKLVSWSLAGKASGASPEVSVTVEPPGLSPETEQRIADAEADIVQLETVTIPALDSELTAAEGRLTTAEGKITAAEGEIDTLQTVTIPGLDADLTAAEGRLTTAEGKITAAEGDISTLQVTTIPALQSEIDAAEGRLTTAEGKLTAAEGELDTLQTTTLPAMQGEIDAAEGRLLTAEGKLSTAESDIATLEGTTIPALQGELDAAETRITTAEGKVSTLETTTIPGLQGEIDAAEGRLTSAETRLTAAEGELDAAQADINTLETVTIPGLNSDLSALDGRLDTAETNLTSAQGQINTLNNTTIPALDGRLDTAETNLTDARTRLATAEGELDALPADISAAQTAANKALLIAPRGTAIPTTADGTVNGVVRPTDSIWTRVDASGNEIGYYRWTGSAWVATTLTATVIPNLAASKITSGTIAADRLDAATVRAKFLAAGKIVAADMVAGTLTSASGVFGTMDASVINAGTLNAARLNAADVRAKFLEAGKVTANDIVAGTLTSASGVFGTMDASVLNAGTLSAARLNAADVRAKFLEAGKVTAADIVTGTLTSASGVFGTMDASVINAGILSSSRIGARSITAEKIAIGDMTNLAAGGEFERAEDLSNWVLVDGTGISIDTTNVYKGEATLRSDGAGAVRQVQRRFPVREGEKLRVSWAHRTTADYNGTAGNGKVRLGDQNGSLKTAYTWLNTADAWTEETKIFTVPAGMSEVQLNLVFDHTLGSIWIDNISVRRMNAGELIVDGTLTAAVLEAGTLTSASGVFGVMDASVINAGTLAADRLDAATVRAKFLAAGKVTASDIVTGTLTSASGVFGTMDASVINAGTLSTARLNATDLRAHVLSAGKISAADMVTGTLTATSGVIASLDASKLTAGTVSTARLNAADLRAHVLSAGKITAGDMVAGTLTATSAAIASLDASKLTAGTVSTARLNAADIRAHVLSAGKITASDMVTGTITATSGIVASLSAAVLTTGTVAADRLDAATIRAKFLAAGKITASDIVAGSITGDSLAATAIDGKTITGGTFNTTPVPDGTTGFSRALAIDSNGLRLSRFPDGGGSASAIFNMDATTGNILAASMEIAGGHISMWNAAKTSGSANLSISESGIWAYDNTDNMLLGMDFANGSLSISGNLSTGKPTEAGTVIKKGLSYDGFGSSVIQMFTRRAHEVAPGEIYGQAEGTTAGGNLSLQLWGPRAIAGGVRPTIQMFGQDSDTAAALYLVGNTGNIDSSTVELHQNGEIQLRTPVLRAGVLSAGTARAIETTDQGITLRGDSGAQIDVYDNTVNLYGAGGIKMNHPVTNRYNAAIDYEPKGLGTTDINTLTAPGVYHQHMNANATSARGYPASWAGLLEVFYTPGDTQPFYYQRYTAYEGGGSQVWTRSAYGTGGWSPWMMGGDQDTGWVNCPLIGSGVMQGSILPQVRRIGSHVYMKWGVNKGSFTANMAASVCNVPSGFRPTEWKYFQIGSSNANADGRITVQDNGDVVLSTGSNVGSYYIFDAAHWFID